MRTNYAVWIGLSIVAALVTLTTKYFIRLLPLLQIIWYN